MTSLRIRVSLATVLLCLISFGCGPQMFKSLREMSTIRNEILRKFGEDANIHYYSAPSGRLVVTYINSKLNFQSTNDRAKRAQETASLVKANFHGAGTVNEIWVVYIKQTTRLAVFHSSQSIDAFGFDSEARLLRRPSDPIVRPEPLAPSATYIENANVTDIALPGIQLEGEVGAGLTLIPHFSVQGDATKNRTKPPESVGFDFAAYSRKPQFTKDMTVALVSDGKVLQGIKGKASSYGAETENVNEFCYVTMSYATFRQFVTGQTLSVRLGKKEYPLTYEHVWALRQMSEFVKK